MAQVWTVDRRKVCDCGEFNRSILVPVLRDHILCLYHKQEAALPANLSSGAGAHHHPILLTP